MRVGVDLLGLPRAGALQQLPYTAGGEVVALCVPGSVADLDGFGHDFSIGALAIDLIVRAGGDAPLNHITLDAMTQGVVRVDHLGAALGDGQQAVVAAPAVAGGGRTIGFADEVAPGVPAVGGDAVLAVGGLGQAIVAVVLVAGGPTDIAAQSALRAVAYGVVLVGDVEIESTRLGLSDGFAQQFASSVVAVAHGAAHRSIAGGDHFRGHGFTARCVQGVVKLGQHAGVGFAVSQAHQLIGGVVPVFGGSTVGAGSLAAVACSVIAEAGFQSVLTALVFRERGNLKPVAINHHPSITP